jgi:hypothetical protein
MRAPRGAEATRDSRRCVRRLIAAKGRVFPVLYDAFDASVRDRRQGARKRFAIRPIASGEDRLTFSSRKIAAFGVA